jgi:hypothetical protein
VKKKTSRKKTNKHCKMEVDLNRKKEYHKIFLIARCRNFSADNEWQDSFVRCSKISSENEQKRF